MRAEFTLDIPCVWSYFTFTRFERAAARFRAEEGELDVVFQPYQLTPEATVAGEPKLEVLRRSFGGEVHDAVARIESLAADEGLLFRHTNAVFSNSFDAHRLISVAASQGRAEPMVERLFRAHHTDELNIADEPTLRRLATEVGVTWPEGGAERVRAELRRVLAAGVRGVPVVRFGDQPALHGAQSEHSLYTAMRAAAHAGLTV